MRLQILILLPRKLTCFKIHVSEEKLIEGQMIELEDGSTAFFQQVTLQKGEVKLLIIPLVVSLKQNEELVVFLKLLY